MRGTRREFAEALVVLVAVASIGGAVLEAELHPAWCDQLRAEARAQFEGFWRIVNEETAGKCKGSAAG